MVFFLAEIYLQHSFVKSPLIKENILKMIFIAAISKFLPCYQY